MPLVILVIAGLLSGCSGSTNSGTSLGSPTESDTAQADPGQGIAKTTTLDSCDTTPGHVTAKGKVTLPEGVQGEVTVSISWINSTNSSVLASGTGTLKNASSNHPTDWEVSTDLTASSVETDTKVSCVLGSVVRAAK
ncbi:hypothetical protein [Arthrobacter alpinus]|nr:hypothetical protein [Arthrobacter alpinus]